MTSSNPVDLSFQVADSLPLAVAFIDASLRYLYINPATEEFLKRSRAEVVGRQISDVIGERAFTQIRQAVETVLRGETVHVESWLSLASVGERFVNAHYTPYRSPEGLQGFSFIAVDTTAQKVREIEQAHLRRLDLFLQKVDERLRALSQPADIMKTAARLLGEQLHAARAGYCELEPDGQTFVLQHEWTDGSAPPGRGRFRLRDFSPFLVNQLVSGRTLMLEDVTQDPRLTAAAAQPFIQTGVKATLSAPIVKDGRTVAALFVSTARPRSWTPDNIRLINEVGERTWSAVLRARADAARFESEERFRAMVENTPVLIWVNMTNGRLDFVNKATRQFFGRDIPRGRRMQELLGAVIPEDRGRCLHAFRTALKAKGPFNLEARFMRVDGKQRWLRLSAAPRFDQIGQFTGHIGMGTDITEAKKAAEHQRWLFREMSHRVMNGFQSVASLLTLQLRSVHDAAALSALKTAGERVQALAMVHRRLYAGTSDTEVDLVSYLRDLCSDLAASFGGEPKREIVWRANAPLSVPHDRAIVVATLIVELVVNAMKHAFEPNEPGRVEVEMDVTGRRCLLSVADNGRGLPPNFETEGTHGLGMMMIKSQAKALSADLNIERLTRGVRFSIGFDCDEPKSDADPSATPEPISSPDDVGSVVGAVRRA